MGNNLRNFDTKKEVLRGLGVPIVDRASRRTSAKSRIDFNRSKLYGVVRQIIFVNSSELGETFRFMIDMFFPGAFYGFARVLSHFRSHIRHAWSLV